ncbi:MAG: DUF1906 domain-containing protein [Hyphomicrobiales bacterium]
MTGGYMKPMRTGLALLLGGVFVSQALADAPSCNTHAEFPVADLSQPVTTITTKSGKSGTEAFKVIGVRTIARYYDWVNADTTCKSLFPAETDVLLKAGFSIVTIFQHENSDPETFLDRARGAKDAHEAIKLAAANGQPPGSMIYFAVDGVDQAIKDSVFEWRVNKGKPVQPARKKRLLSADPSFRKHIKFYERFRLYHKARFGKDAEAITERDMIPFVDHYFTEVNRVMKADGRYRIGVYGSGMMCRHVLDKKLAGRCWLAMSTGWPQSKEFTASGRWSLIQQRTTFCKNWQFKGRETARFDFSRVKGKDFGQWSKKGPVTPTPDLPATCKPSW